MRSIDPTQDANLAANHRSSHVRVFVERDGAGTMQNMTDFNGIDWVDSCELSNSIDSPGMTCKVELLREADGDSLSTLMSTSAANNVEGYYLPVVEPGRAVWVQACVLPPNTTPTGADFELIFVGEIDTVDFGKKRTVTISARDKINKLVSGWIEEEKTYGTDTGRPIEQVMQDILNTWAPGVDLYSANGTLATPWNPIDSPGFNILIYNQSKQSVHSALDAIAKLIGWQIRYRWHNGPGGFVLVFESPDRAKTIPDRAFNHDAYEAIERASISRMNIRNVIKVLYTSTDTGNREQVTAADPTSIITYDRQYMEIGEAGSSQIDTAAEAQTLADAALSDLSSPAVEQSVSMPLFWPIELGDLYRFVQNGVHYDNDIDLAVVQYTHVFSGGNAKTRMLTRGKPAGAYKQWLALDRQLYTYIGERSVRTRGANTTVQRGANVVPNGNFEQVTGLEDVPPDGFLVGDTHPEGHANTIGDWGSEILISASPLGDPPDGGKVIRVEAQPPYTILTQDVYHNLRQRDPIQIEYGYYVASFEAWVETIGGPDLWTISSNDSGPQLFVEGFDSNKVKIPYFGGYLAKRTMERRPSSAYVTRRLGFYVGGSHPSAQTPAPAYVRVSVCPKWGDFPSGGGPTLADTWYMDLSNIAVRRIAQKDRALLGSSQSIAPSTWITVNYFGGIGFSSSQYHSYSNGDHQVSVSLGMSAMTKGNTLQLRIIKDGDTTSPLATASITTVKGINLIEFVDEILECPIGSYLEVQVWHDDAAARSTLQNNDISNGLFEATQAGE